MPDGTSVRAFIECVLVYFELLYKVSHILQTFCFVSGGAPLDPIVSPDYIPADVSASAARVPKSGA